MKKALSVFLALALLLALTVPALADEPEDTEPTPDAVFEIDADGVLTAYTGSGGDVAVPEGVTAIGDRAFDQATRALRAALLDHPREDHRHGIIHDCLPTEEGIKICRDYHIAMPVQSAFINWKQEPDEYLESIMGKERCSRLNPIKTFADNGIVVSLGSDAPCTSPNPIVWMDRCVNNPNKEQRVSVQQALRMATWNGYYTTFDEKERGSLEKGKIADMVILSANPYETEELKSIKVEQLLLAGKPYQSAQEGVLGAVLRGLCSKNKF